MCGINGIVSKSSQDSSIIGNLINRMNGCIVHRGPDDNGVFCRQADSYSIGMGMQRLSIIDLNTGHQPMSTDDGDISIVFNGEIYNYKILKDKLLDKGISFNTTSDTEVILKLYEQDGEACFKALDGMFGLSLFDRKKNKIFIARDFFGEKPLYFTDSDKAFIWGSELKSVVSVIDKKPEISKSGLNLFFRLTYIPAPFTIYEGIKKLEPNHLLIYDLDKKSYSTKTIHPKFDSNPADLSFEQAKKTTKDRVYDSVVSRSVSDVPIGTFLSGGVDSSVVSLCLAQYSQTRIDTFSIGFKKKSYDETDKSRTVAKQIGSNHHEFIIDESDLKENVDAILLNFDEPFADSSALPTYLVSRKTSDYVKVALTGDGGDEIFGGYNKYYMGKLNSRYTNIMPKSLHKSMLKLSAPLLKTSDDSRGKRYKVQRALQAVDYSDSFYWDIISLGMTESHLNQFLNQPYLKQDIFDYYKRVSGLTNPKTLNDFQTIDRHLSLEGDMLVKVDRTSMLNSLECRAPFLNRDLLEFTMSLPEDYLLKGWNKKYLLKEAFRDEFPEGFLDKSKRGFGVPVGDWLREGLREELVDYANRDFLEEQAIFNLETILKLVDNHLKGKVDNTFKVWSFFCFQKWYKNIYSSL
ncbi:MAG: asparagine synthase (glutamine-hydrolyzing) [Bacteroidia bacterium]|nr:asparagine synthase (glutamine-hydrolyzing) [Bacteroidia bacterium]